MLHMDEKTNEENMLKYNLKSNSNYKDYLKLYIPDPDQYTTVEGVSLSIVGPPKPVKYHKYKLIVVPLIINTTIYNQW